VLSLAKLVLFIKIKIKTIRKMVTPGGKQRTISSFFAPKQASQKSSIVTNSTTTPTAADSTKPVNSTTKSTHDTVGNIVNERGVPAITKTSIKESVKEIIDRENSDRDDDDGIVPPSSRLRRRCSKRTLSDDDGEDDEDDKDGEYKDLYSTPLRKSTKRLRRSPSSSVELYADEGSAGENDFLAPPKPKSSQRSPVPPAAETSRFRYDPSQMDVDVAEDPERKKQKVKLREKFVKKLGRVEILSRDDIDKDKELPEETTGEQEDPEEEELGPIAKRFGKGVAVSSKKSSSKTAGPKLTPLEKQVVAIKHQYPDTVLVVEVGYKFRFFGEDARIASQNLSIMCIPGKMRFDNHPSEAHLDRFASASIPVPRLHVHVKRLITAGLKVGVVRQLETAALKAAGDNKSAPFERKLTNLYTKGTYIDDIDAMDGGDWSSGAGSGGAPNTGFLLCLTEKPGGGSGADERVQVGFVAVQPSTGEVIYDDFEDGFMRSEIETRLLHSTGNEYPTQFV
jgi:DNA mismatch repair protein MSH3